MRNHPGSHVQIILRILDRFPDMRIIRVLRQRLVQLCNLRTSLLIHLKDLVLRETCKQRGPGRLVKVRRPCLSVQIVRYKLHIKRPAGCNRVILELPVCALGKRRIHCTAGLNHRNFASRIAGCCRVRGINGVAGPFRWKE